MKNLSIKFAIVGLSFALFTTIAFQAHADKDIMLVLDNSGSMRKNDPKFVARTAVASFIEELTQSTRAGVLIFDQNVEVPVPLTVADGVSKQKLIASLSDINYRGQLTDSPAAMERAIYELKTNGREGAEKIIVFMTDGIVDTGNAEADVEKTKWLRDELSVDANDNGIKVYAIAFTEHADFFLIQSLAKKTGGEYFRALTPDDLTGVFSTASTQIFAAPAVVAPVVVETPSAPVAEPVVEAPQPDVVVIPPTEEPIETKLLAPDADTAALLASLNDEERLALEDIHEQTGIPLEQLVQELVGPSDPGVESTVGPPPIITVAPDEPSDEDVKSGALILGAAAALLLLLVVAVVWFIRRRRSAPTDPSESATSAGGAASATPAIPEAFINDINNYTDDPAVQLGEKPMVVGRVAGSDTEHLDYLVINKGTVGRRHAIVKYKDYSFWIVDQGSVNGTYVNGDRVSGERQLKHGDKIRFHKYDFEFSQPEMDDGFHTVFADPNAAEATIVASAATMAATVAMEVKPAEAADDPADDDDDLFGVEQEAADAAVAAVSSVTSTAAFADSDIFDITGESDMPGAGDETMEESATAVFEAPPEIGVPPVSDDDVDDPDTLITFPEETSSAAPSEQPAAAEQEGFEYDEDEDEDLGVDINLDTVGADDHPSLILDNPPSLRPPEDFDAEASAFFEDITVGPTPDDAFGPDADDNDGMFGAPEDDDQSALDAKLEQATAILDGDDDGEIETVALSDLPQAADPKDVTLDQFIETDSFDAPATAPPVHPSTVAGDDPGDVTLDAFMNTSMFEAGNVPLTNEDETVLPDHVPDQPGASDDPIGGDTVVLPGSPVAQERDRNTGDADDEDDDDSESEDPTILR